jgi:2-dehydro-3-deoxy-D-arabinonate dehydratase
MLKLFRYDADGPRLGVETDDGRFDLTSVNGSVFGSLAGWLSQENPMEILRSAATRVLESVPDDALLLPPVDLQEVWAAGVTYERSKVARMEESEGGGDFYDKVYAAERPELFMKAVGWRVVGPGQPIRVRSDSTWDVPEPEMTLVLSSAGKIVGVTIGNDVSSRSIEGENPLYLPQAKCYNGAAALGPSILLVEEGVDLRNLTIGLEIVRAGDVAYSDQTTTARMKRHPQELADYLFREMDFPHGALLMTGTGLVPPDSFTLRSGDIVSITISGVGTLTNPVA